MLNATSEMGLPLLVAVMSQVSHYSQHKKVRVLINGLVHKLIHVGSHRDELKLDLCSPASTSKDLRTKVEKNFFYSELLFAH